MVKTRVGAKLKDAKKLTFVAIQMGADAAQIEAQLKGFGLWPHPQMGAAGHLGFAIEPHSMPIDPQKLQSIAGIADVFWAPSAHPLVDAQADRAFEDWSPKQNFLLIAGPCCVESPEQIGRSAQMAARAGASWLRGGAFKPRTSPYAFKGYGATALDWLRSAADAHHLKAVTELVAAEDAALVAEKADAIQIGARNMQNYALLKAAGETHRPLLLKRGMSASLEDWLLAGEHALLAGAEAVIFCERGIAGLGQNTRNLLDLATVALLKRELGQPVIVDPSHAVGRRDLIPCMAEAACVAGADGVMVEIHPEPGKALSDGSQALDAAGLQAVAEGLKRVWGRAH